MLTWVKNVKNQVFEALKDDEVEQNKQGEVVLHGHAVWTWTTSIPGAPLREGGLGYMVSHRRI